MALTIKQNSSNNFTVTDHGANLGTFTPVSRIFVTGTNGSDSIGLNLNANVYAGDFTVNSGNGNDTVQIFGGGTMKGNTLIASGLGNDSVDINSTGAAAMTFGGNIQAVGNIGGNKTLNFGNAGAATSVLSSLSVVGFNTVNLGAGGSDSIFGSATVQDGFLGIPVTINVANNMTILQSLSLSTGQGKTVVTIGSDTVGANLSVTMGAGNDSVFVSGAGTGTVVGGNLSVSGTTGNDTINLNGTETIGGGLFLSLGDGTDSVGVTPNTVAVGGDLVLSLGSGNDTVIEDAIISGNGRFFLGAGNDTVTIGNAPAGLLQWNSGNGNDSVTFGDGQTAVGGELWNVFMWFGTGNDTLTLVAGPGGTANPQGLSGFIDMGGPPNQNSFDPTNQLGAGTWVIVFPFNLQNV
jgi:hypothetical protein